MARVYISENNRDSALAKRIAGALSKLGHSVSADVDFLLPGAEWQQQIREQLVAADGLLVLVTENSVEQNPNRFSSQWVAADVGAARALGKFVIPLVIPGTPLPAPVTDLFAVTLKPEDDRDFEEKMSLLDKAFAFHLEKKASASSLGLPPGFEHLASAVQRFHEDYRYEESVFVMMKFPDPTTMTPEDIRLLEDIWTEVDRVLNAYGLKARRADKKSYHEQLWENICVHILGSRYGIAVLEDRIAAELNPNVTLEYGFMKALNRPVALLREIHFRHDRADLTGKLSKPFEIGDDKQLKSSSLRSAVQEWLFDVGVPQRQRV